MFSTVAVVNCNEGGYTQFPFYLINRQEKFYKINHEKEKERLTKFIEKQKEKKSKKKKSSIQNTSVNFSELGSEYDIPSYFSFDSKNFSIDNFKINK